MFLSHKFLVFTVLVDSQMALTFRNIILGCLLVFCDYERSNFNYQTNFLLV